VYVYSHKTNQLLQYIDGPITILNIASHLFSWELGPQN